MTSGRYSYLIEFKGEYYFHRAIIDYRKESILRNSIKIGQFEDEGIVDSAFNKANSVFWEWQEDTEESLENAKDHDIKALYLSSYLPKIEK